MTRADIPSFAENMATFMLRAGNPEAASFWSLIDFDQQCDEYDRVQWDASFRIPGRPA